MLKKIEQQIGISTGQPDLAGSQKLPSCTHSQRCLGHPKGGSLLERQKPGVGKHRVDYLC
jgi:hypothetical protein